MRLTDASFPSPPMMRRRWKGFYKEGITSEEVYVVVARPDVGKTISVMHVARANANIHDDVLRELDLFERHRGPEGLSAKQFNRGSARGCVIFGHTRDMVID